MIFLSALLDVCELNHAKDIEKQLNEQFLKDTDVEAHIKLITRKSIKREVLEVIQWFKKSSSISV